MNMDSQSLKIGEIMALAYLLGSIPFSWIAGKLIKGIDIRKHGSGNAGATNVWRIMGPGPGLVVGLLDMAKGWVAVAIVGWIYQDSTRSMLINVEVLAGLLAVIGHSWPVWLGFRGGKGVLTAGGAFLYLAWLPMICSLAVFVLVFFAFKYVSLGSMIAAVFLPVFIILIRGPWHRWQVLAIAIAIAVFIVVRHIPNIKRLLAGKEHGFKAKSGGKTRRKGGKRR